MFTIYNKVDKGKWWTVAIMMLAVKKGNILWCFNYCFPCKMTSGCRNCILITNTTQICVVVHLKGLSCKSTWLPVKIASYLVIIGWLLSDNPGASSVWNFHACSSDVHSCKEASEMSQNIGCFLRLYSVWRCLLKGLKMAYVSQQVKRSVVQNL